MNELKTILGTDIPIETRGILYICKYTGTELKVLNEIMFNDSFEALNAYANIPNPESQIVMGENFDGLIKELISLHKMMQDPEWLKSLGEYL